MLQKKLWATNLVPRTHLSHRWNALIQSDTFTFFMRRKVSLMQIISRASRRVVCLQHSKQKRGSLFIHFLYFIRHFQWWMSINQRQLKRRGDIEQNWINRFVVFLFVCLDFIFEFIYCYLKTDQQKKDEIKFFWIVSFTLNGSLINAMGKVWIA